MHVSVLPLFCLSLLASAAAAMADPAVFLRHRASEGETLMDIARDHGLGFVELQAANPGVDPWLPEPGLEVTVPILHLAPAAVANPGIVVNLADMRLYLLRSDTEGELMTAKSFAVGIGREGWETPVGVTEIVRKRRDPVWIPPKSIRAERPGLPAVVAAGPDNPLGRHALDLGWQNYVIHGTNKPDGVGRQVSHGCLRLYPEGIESLFAEVSVGTPVTVVDEPLKFGWIDGELYMEAHPTREQSRQLDLTGRMQDEPVGGLRRTIKAFLGEREADIHWGLAERVARQRRGVAVRITR